VAPLLAQLANVRVIHRADLLRGGGDVWQPGALAVKYPKAAPTFGWQYVFPAAGLSLDPRSATVRRHQVDEKRVRRAVKAAAEAAGIVKPVSPHTPTTFWNAYIDY